MPFLAPHMECPGTAGMGKEIASTSPAGRRARFRRIRGGSPGWLHGPGPWPLRITLGGLARASRATANLAGILLVLQRAA
jgi:hypothetical protein